MEKSFEEILNSEGVELKMDACKDIPKMQFNRKFTSPVLYKLYKILEALKGKGFTMFGNDEILENRKQIAEVMEEIAKVEKGLEEK